MPLGMAPTTCNSVLDAIFRGIAYPGLSQRWLRLHTGPPAAGGSALAGNYTRKLVSCSASNNGSISSSADMNWATGEVNTTETYTNFSIFDTSGTGGPPLAGGNFIMSGTVTSNQVTAGDQFIIGLGQFTVLFTPAS